MFLFKKWLCLAGLVAGSAHPVWAIDVVETAPPQVVGNNQLTIGNRTLRLPEGAWNFVAKKKGVVIMTTRNDAVIGTTYHAYAMDVRNGRFHNGVELLLPEYSFNASGWKPEPCKKEGYLFMDDFDSGYKTPECLLIYKRASHLARPSGEFYPQAAQWAAKGGIKLPGAVYEITYIKYATNDYGVVRVWLPADQVADDEAVVAWARGLPERLKRFFERREDEAFLPPIPSLH